MCVCGLNATCPVHAQQRVFGQHRRAPGRHADMVAVMQVMRGKKTAYEGTLSSLRRVKESVKEIDQGNECGVGCKEFIGWEEGDKIQAFELVSKRRTLEDIVAGPQQQMAAVQ